MFNDSNKAIYLQIADTICDKVLDGSYAPGDRLPSVREYAAAVEVNANTVMRSYEYLAARDVIANKRGIGFFVTPAAPDVVKTMRNEELLEKEIFSVFRRLRLLGISPESLKAKYEQYLQTPNPDQQ